MPVESLLGFDLADQHAFNAAYWASFDPIINAAFNPNGGPQPHPMHAINGPTPVPLAQAEVSFNELILKAIELSQRGFKIDVPIMLWAMDPYVEMRIRQGQGFSSVPALGEAPTTLPPSLGGAPNAGSIKVSINPADFPPFPVPVVAPEAPVTSPVGPRLFGKTHIAFMPASFAWHNGQSASFAGVTYVLSYPNIFSPAYWIEQ